MTFSRLTALLTFLLMFVTTSLANAGLFDRKNDFLPAEQAFAFSAQVDGNQVQLNWQIAPEYYLYQKSIHITGQNAHVAPFNLPESELHHDDFFGEVGIYRDELSVNVPVSQVQEKGQLEVEYQGCTANFCYPPQTQTVMLNASVQQSAVAMPEAQPNMQSAVTTATENESELNVWWFFVLGLGLAFTPCVLPMLPLLSSIVIGQQQRPNSLRALMLSVSYVQGMALTYTALGLLVVSIGLPFQQALQSPYVLIGFTVLFVILALAMFGLFELQLPNSWQNKLMQLSQKQQGGAYGSVFVMGMIAGLVASPCISAPLSGALLYVAQSGDFVTGGLALYLLALGMGVPLVLVTLFGNAILPKGGEWQAKVKTAFGFVMLAVPVFLLSRLLSDAWGWRLWSVLAVSFLIWLIVSLPMRRVWLWLKVPLFGLLIIAGYPLAQLAWQAQSAVHVPNKPHFMMIESVDDLARVMREHPNKIVMLDLYADWCVACKEFDKYTFPDAAVRAQFDNMLLLRADLTKTNAKNRTLMEKFQVLGLPTILFFSPQGQELTAARVSGFMPPEQFAEHLSQLKAQ
ncbi:protein-disulfide reductase DsbD [Pasteurellaceae bacterium HPA106]|uniref:protein-disulfide reductase DsbD n=1 Tax=Spirabiliibacterium pneumoniae TaxID=221400 RepID=UPI001AAD62BE|nr:protein-disulfide reductase DsbD [Spirabiliibacterium pneumoniae]MBE2895864.1 protein-disulfide reductase DsbD [Spirabiliibacterium pneumoniae]